MSPTILKIRGYRFFFFSREENRMHIHVHCGDGEAKFGLEPEIELAHNYSLSQSHLGEIERLVKEHHHEFTHAWKNYFRT